MKTKTNIILVIIVVLLLVLFIFSKLHIERKFNNNTLIKEIDERKEFDSDEIIYNVPDKIKYEMVEYAKEEVYEKEFINTCINNNKNLSIEEIEAFTIYNNFIRDFSFSVNEMSRICNEIRKVNVNYVVKSDKKVSGTFYRDSTIKIYTSNVEDRLIAILGHEGFHAISNNINKNSIGLLDYDKGVGTKLNEGLTQLLTEEYFGDIRESVYYSEVLIVKMLLEIVEPKIMIESYINGNIDLLIDAILGIDSSVDRERIINFIRLIDDNQNNINRIIDEMDYYYMLSKGKHLKEDKLMNAYKLKLFNDFNKSVIGDIANIEVIKYYFDTTLINQNPSTIITTWKIEGVLRNGKIKVRADTEELK